MKKKLNSGVFSKNNQSSYSEVLIGKTYGDPHIKTFDGYRYSFKL